MNGAAMDFSHLARDLGSVGPVMPISGKVPMWTDWPNRATRTPNGENEWQQATGVGLVTGEAAGYFVLDVDADKGGFETLAALEAEHGALPPTWTSHTGGGGRHYFFRHPEFTVKGSAGKLGPGLDVRGWHGFVVAPGSRHKSGGVYAWAPERRPGEVELADAPPGLLDRLREPERKPVAAPPPPPGPHSDVRRRASAYLARMDPAIEGQDGSGALWRAAQAMIRGFQLPESDACALIAAEYNPRCEPPWSEKELFHKIRDAVEKSSVPWGYLLDHDRPLPGSASRSLEEPPRFREEPGCDDGDDDIGRLRVAEAQQRADADTDAADPRPVILITTEERAVVDAALEALVSDPYVFQVDGVGLVHVLRDPGEELAKTGLGRQRGSPRVALLPKATLRERLTSCARWVKANKRAHPPVWAIDALHARGIWPGVRRLDGVVEAPTLRPDGTVIQAGGYDAATGLLYHPVDVVLPVPDSPTREDARRALDELAEVVIDFPFAGPEHLAAWLASLLTPIAAAGQAWAAPMFLFDANTRGTGKTLLADLVAMLITSRPMPRMTLSEDNEEARKALFALALGGEALAFFDEARVLRGAALNAALTGRVIRDRVLGESRDATATLRATFYAAGNNVQVKGDTVRRVIHVRLESQHEHPEERADFKHVDVRAWVLAERPRLVRAALTILRAYHLAGRPVAVTPLGSFEGWSRAVRDPLIWAGAEDPCKTRAALLEADSEETLLRQLLSGWREVAGDEAISVREAVTRLQRSPGLRAAFEEMGAATSEKINAVSVGHRLAHYQGRWCGGMRLAKGRPGRTGVTPWRVESSGSQHPSITGAAEL